MKNYLVTGGTSGLGRCIVNRLVTSGNFVFVTGLAPQWEELPAPLSDRYKYACIDLSRNDQQFIQQQVADLVHGSSLDVLINCAGINAIDWLPQLDQHTLDSVMSVNVNSILYITQAVLSKLAATAGTIVNVVSNAYRMPMTHSWIYNASKGAAAIVTRQMARELQKTHGVCVFGICPNKMKGTQMSDYIDQRVCELRGWTKEQAQQYQLNGLVPGFETDPDWIAELLVWLLSEDHRHKYLSGCLLETGY